MSLKRVTRIIVSQTDNTPLGEAIKYQVGYTFPALAAFIEILTAIEAQPFSASLCYHLRPTTLPTIKTFGQKNELKRLLLSVPYFSLHRRLGLNAWRLYLLAEQFDDWPEFLKAAFKYDFPRLNDDNLTDRGEKILQVPKL